MFEVGKFRKKDETRLRLTSPVDDTVSEPGAVGGRGSDEHFLIFPPQTSKKNYGHYVDLQWAGKSDKCPY